MSKELAVKFGGIQWIGTHKENILSGVVKNEIIFSKNMLHPTDDTTGKQAMSLVIYRAYRTIPQELNTGFKSLESWIHVYLNE